MKTIKKLSLFILFFLLIVSVVMASEYKLASQELISLDECRLTVGFCAEKSGGYIDVGWGGERYSTNVGTKIRAGCCELKVNNRYINNTAESETCEIPGSYVVFTTTKIPCHDDGICDSDEDCRTYPNDCPCSIMETCGYNGKTNECGTTCGNHACEPYNGETCETCKEDCRFLCVECGDGICKHDGESCSSCPKDCGACPYCGDGWCTMNETCIKDDCCNGERVYLSKDTMNCGSCGVKCKNSESCLNGACRTRTYCGDGFCNGAELTETCPEDCNEAENMPNITKQNISNQWNEPIKEESKKQCETGCFSDAGCVQLGSSGMNNGALVYCDGENWVSKKELNENCQFDYECKINSCTDNTCKEKIVAVPVQKTGGFSGFWNWLKGLFK